MSDQIPGLIELERRDGDMVLRYEDGTAYEVDYRTLRLFCPCAGCSPKRGEADRRAELVASIEALVIEKPRVGAVGSYALNFEWSQGCNSGIYTFERLYKLACGEDADDGKPYIHGVW